MIETAQTTSLSAFCLRENLQRGLAYVARAVASRGTLPVLGHILVASDRGQLKLVATDLEIAITTWVGAVIDGDGALTVPARLLIDLIGSLPNERVSLLADPASRSLVVRCARARATIKGGDADDFPIIPAVEGQPLARIEAARLREMIGQVAFAAARDDQRPVLAGVSCVFDGVRLTLAAADGVRLSIRAGDLADPATDRTSLLVSARALVELARLLADGSEPVAVAVAPNRGQAHFRTDAVDLVSRLIDGSFPDYQQLVPADATTRAVVDTQALLAATRRATAFASDTGMVTLTLTPGGDDGRGGIVLAAGAVDVGDHTSELEADVTGSAAAVAFNVRLLGEALSAVRSSRVELATQGPTQPGVLRQAGDRGFTHVLMPMIPDQR